MKLQKLHIYKIENLQRFTFQRKQSRDISATGNVAINIAEPTKHIGNQTDQKLKIVALSRHKRS